MAQDGSRSVPPSGRRRDGGGRDGAAARGRDPGTPERARDRTVGEVARLARVSVRTLHHYDAIGLLTPGRRGENGYRRYRAGDLRRLQRILAYRALGFELDAIRAMLDDPSDDEVTHLRRQKALLDARLERLTAMRRALERTLEARQMGIELNPEEMLEVFGDADPTAYAAEAEERWGDTEAYRESQRRARRYDKEAWVRIRDEMEAVEQRFAELLQAGVPADDPRAMAAADAHRQHISRWFYDCGTEMHVGLADMYQADPRFRRHYEDRAAGLAAYVAAAIRANAERS